MEEIKKRVRDYFKDNTGYVSSHSMTLDNVLTIVHTNGLYTVRVHAHKELDGFNYVVDYKSGSVREYIIYMRDIDTLDDLEDCLTELQLKIDTED